jgi:putative FmdB family regulatory protein
MPFYEYQCKSCGHELEAMQKVSDAPLKKCPHCGKSQLTRLMSAPVFRLKGGGWYETDFKDKDNQRNVADRPEEPAKDKADAKPAEEKGKDGKDAKTADTKATDSKMDATATKESGAGKEKTAEKPADKASTGAQKSSARKSAPRVGRTKKKPVKVKRRR